MARGVGSVSWSTTAAPSWSLELLDEADDPSDETCPECGAEIDRDDEGDWVHVIRDEAGLRIASTLDHQE